MRNHPLFPNFIISFNRFSFWVSLLGIILLLYDLGFAQTKLLQNILLNSYSGILVIGFFSIFLRYLSTQSRVNNKKIWLFDGSLNLAILFHLLSGMAWISIPFFESDASTYLLLLVLFLREASTMELSINKKHLNPAQLFITSFLVIIIFGALLLSLPKATYSGISFLDALFTATSAVCVTGLIVVDTGSYFTVFGQWIIIFLIQVGGIGIMTFTSYFSYFFRGGSSYENQLLLKDLTNSEKIGEVFSTLKKIVLLTLIIEAIGAGLIFSSLEASMFPEIYKQLFFSIFHAVSAFCNAGFSTLPNSLYEAGFRFNYTLHVIIALLFIIGGIGFPIVFNFFKYVKHLFVSRILRKEVYYLPWLINLNTRIVLITTGILLVAGTVVFYCFEYQNTLAEHQGIGKWITAFFGAATPRTAGFNSIDTATLQLPTLMIIFLLMWIGASPGSTGGGIKTTAFAIGTLNFLSVSKGKDRLEVFRREVSGLSLRRAFAVISLSLIVIGISVFMITIFNPEQELLAIAFESFSAYSTVGLSLGLTGSLSAGSKLVLIVTMFIGRVSMLTILVAFLRRMKHLKYRYPAEDILIN